MKKLLTSFFGLVLALVLTVVGFGLLTFPPAFFVMLLLGNASLASGGAVPALGFEASYWLTLIFMFLAGMLGSAAASRPKA